MSDKNDPLQSSTPSSMTPPPTTDEETTMKDLDSLLFFPSIEIPELFADLHPIPQDDGDGMICCIDYPAGFTLVYDYFRAVLQAKEVSPRVFGLTTWCLHHNPANYTVWHVRRQCFHHVLVLLQQQQTAAAPDDAEGQQEQEGVLITYEQAKQQELLDKELEYTATLGGSNPKNYQIWYHRRSLLESLVKTAAAVGSESSVAASLLCDRYVPAEFSYLDSVFQVDGKNYHAWSHRQWFVLAELSLQQKQQESLSSQPLNILEQELQYTAELIERDIRNNSAWNHRWFVLHVTPQKSQKQEPLPWKVAQSQVQFTYDKIVLDPYNESSCRFLVALCKETCRSSAADQSSSVEENIVLSWILEWIERLQSLVSEEEDDDKATATPRYPDAAPVLSACVDLCELLMLLQQQNQSTTQSMNVPKCQETARSLLIRLCSVDPIRIKYWNWRLDQLRITTTTATN